MSNEVRVVLAVMAYVVLPLFGSSFPRLVSPRAPRHVLVRPDNKLYVIGSDQRTDASFSTLEVYDPLTQTTELIEMPIGLSPENAAAPLPGNGIVMGGLFLYTYYPNPVGWQLHRDKPSGFESAFTLLKDGRLLDSGGRTGIVSIRGTAVINPVTLQWRSVGFLNEARYAHTTVRLADGRVLALGNNALLGSLFDEIYDPATERWTPIPGKARFRRPPRAVLLSDGRILAADGGDAATFDPLTSEWSPVPGLEAWNGARMLALPDGRVLIAGGVRPTGEILDRVTYYVPSTGRAILGKPMTIPRSGHGMAVLADGTVLALGGRTAGNTLTASVERIPWEEPLMGTAVGRGFHVVSAAQSRGSGTDGFWGAEAQLAEVAGGIHFGGLLAGAGEEPGFGAFTISEPQSVSIRVLLRALPGATSPAAFRLNLMDQRRVAILTLQSVDRLEWSGNLVEGNYIVELRSAALTPLSAFDVSLSVPRLKGSVSAGGVLRSGVGVPGYLAFYASAPQDVVIYGYDWNSYGNERGVRGLSLTLYDAAGRVIDSSRGK